MIKRFSFAFAIASTALSLGCATRKSQTDSIVLPQPAAAPGAVEERNRLLNELARAPAVNPATGGPVQNLRIGADDLLQVTVFEALEMGGSVRVSAAGDISLPLIGAVRAAGSTPEELARLLEQRLRAKYMRDPHVSVQMTEAHSQPVSVVGAVKQPGLIQLRSTRPLLEVLAMAGGLADDAGETVLVTRVGGAQSLEVDLGTLLRTADARYNVSVHPGDVITVQRAGVIYVVGEVNKAGAFSLTSGTQLTVLQALALGEGLSRNASRGRAIVVRTGATGERTAIPVDVRSALAGGGTDMQLQPNDIVFVPSSKTRAFTMGAVDALVRMVTFRGVL